MLTGAGDRAFCTGADQSTHEGSYGGRGTLGLPIDELQSLIRDIPKPVIARVQGFAIGGGNVLATLCDFTIASEKAVFGQVGPKVGSVDPGFGTAYLSRIVGEKRAREIWYLCRRYSAKEAYDMGLVNAVVPPDQLDAEVDKWCAEIVERSPTAIAIAKRSFNADTEHQRAIGMLGFEAVALYYGTEEFEGGRPRLPREASAQIPQVKFRSSEQSFMRIPLSIGITDNPRTWPVIEQRVKPDGIDLVPTVLHPSELFWRQLRFSEFDVSEMSISSLMIARSKGDDRFVGIPVFTTRLFFHTTILVRKDAKIDKPADLKGKRVGVPEYQQTAALWVRGVLENEFGVTPKRHGILDGAQSGQEPRRRHRLQAAAGRHRQPDPGGQEHRLDDGVGRARRRDVLSGRSRT